MAALSEEKGMQSDSNLCKSQEIEIRARLRLDAKHVLFTEGEFMPFCAVARKDIGVLWPGFPRSE
jgi:hypothetical protein